MHLRAPSIDHGVQSFLWAVVFFLFLWFGMLAVGVSGATAFVLALVLAAADLPVRPDLRRGRARPAGRASPAPASALDAEAAARRPAIAPEGLDEESCERGPDAVAQPALRRL